MYPLFSLFIATIVQATRYNTNEIYTHSTGLLEEATRYLNSLNQSDGLSEDMVNSNNLGCENPQLSNDMNDLKNEMRHFFNLSQIKNINANQNNDNFCVKRSDKSDNYGPMPEELKQLNKEICNKLEMFRDLSSKHEEYENYAMLSNIDPNNAYTQQSNILELHKKYFNEFYSETNLILAIFRKATKLYDIDFCHSHSKNIELKLLKKYELLLCSYIHEHLKQITKILEKHSEIATKRWFATIVCEIGVEKFKLSNMRNEFDKLRDECPRLPNY